MRTRSPSVRRMGRGLALLVAFGAVGATVRLAAGDPTAQLAALRDLGDPVADPVEPVLASLALLAEALCGYLLLLTALGTASTLPGVFGRLAVAGFRILGTPSIRRCLDGVLGGVLLAHVALGPSAQPAFATTAAMPTASRAVAERAPASWTPSTSPSSAGPPELTGTTGSAVAVGGVASAALGAVVGPVPPATRPSPGFSGDPGPAVHVVARGDTLWDVAERHLPAGHRSPSTIAAYWPRLHAANRRVIGADPDRLLPGMRLIIPPAQVTADDGGDAADDRSPASGRRGGLTDRLDGGPSGTGPSGSSTSPSGSSMSPSGSSMSPSGSSMSPSANSHDRAGRPC